jgi:hypothetical protein
MQRRAGGWIGALIALAALLTPASAVSDEAPPAVVALLVDTSGSIRPQDLAQARAIATSLAQSLPGGSQIAVFTFDDQSRLVLPRTADRGAIARALDGAKIAGQWTALNDALYDASRYLRDAPSVRRAIVLVTDGQDENSALNLDDALALAEATNIPVFAVGVGHPQDRVLRRIAKLTSGQYATGVEARGDAFAAAIARLPLPPAAARLPPGATPQPEGRLSPPSGPQTAPEGGSIPKRAPVSGSLPIATLAGVGLLVLVLFAALVTRRKARPRCATCGRDLPGALSPCVFCAANEDLGKPFGHDQTLPPTTMPETVMARLNGTEEFLEKTVTLRENPLLAITKGPGTGQLFPLHLESATSLGRAKANDIVLSDVAVSSQHCRIRPEEGRFVLHDLRSTNGTFVNERRVSRYALNEGDTIKIGETFLQFKMDQKRS